MKRLKFFAKENKDTVIAAAILLLFSVIAFLSSYLFFAVTILIASVAYCAYLYYRFNAKYRNVPVSSDNAMTTLTVDVLTKLGLPIIMISADDNVAWYNKAFAENKDYFGTIKYGQSCKELCGGTISHAALKKAKSHYDIKCGEKVFSVYPVEVSTMGNNYFLAMLVDASDRAQLETMLKNRNIIVGYAAVDNAAEISSYLQDSYRSTVAKAYTELYNWVTEMDGIVREYDRDKYIIFVDEEKFAPNINKKFDIIEKINNTVAGDSNRLTLSMSFARIQGSLTEKEAAAKSALDYAFQRGGAQVIVKTETGSTSYGGQIKAMERTTKIKSRVTADKLKELMISASNVIVMGHKNIDVDAIAAACAVARFAMELQKPINIVVNADDKALETALGLLEGLDEYDNVFVDRVRGQELLEPDSLVVIVDVSNPVIFEAPDIYKNAQNVAIIDHHVQTNEFEVTPLLQYIDPTASSASELMCEVLEQALQRSVLKTGEAELLYAGIMLDTQHLTRNMGVRTFGAAMYLRLDAKMLAKAQGLFKPDIREYTKQAVFRKNTVLYKDCIGISYYDGDILPENHLMASIAADGMLGISSVKASFALCTVGNNVHISGRSDGSINVALILEKLGGGGRFEAAATVMEETTMRQARERLHLAIDEHFNDKNGIGGNL